MKPSKYSVVIMLLLSIVAIVAEFYSSVGEFWRIALMFFLALSLLDFFRLWVMKDFRVRRNVNKNLAIYSWSEVVLQIRHGYRQSVSLTVHDHYPTDFLVEGQPFDIQVSPEKGLQIKYRVKPLQRGDAVFSGTDLLVTSPLRLWQKRMHISIENNVRVYPNFGEVVHFALLATDNHLSQMGIRKRQRRGEGQDFHQLREYRVGDSMKQIDWKATSRYMKPISREYQDERDQQIIFLIDCGRRMRHMENGQAHLDQALNAMLLLSYVAVRQGDAAGFYSFAGTERWFPPCKGQHILNQLLDQSYDLASTTEAADYISVARKLLGLQRKRALVVLLTNTRDEDRTDLQQAAKLLSRKHLVVLADLREPGLYEAIETKVNDLDSALMYQGVQDYLHRRKKTHDFLNHTGAICLDTTAEKLPISLVNQYLSIKQSGRL